MAKELDYKVNLAIDPMALDMECMGQPGLMVDYAGHLAFARKQVDLAKEDVDVTKAELDKKIRTDPDSFGVAKITEEVVKNTILLQDKYREVYHHYLDVKEQTDLLELAVRALAARKDMLQEMVKLWLGQYFAGPKVPRDLGAAILNKLGSDRADENVRTAVRRRTQPKGDN